MFTAQDWPIACNMLPFGPAAPDGTPTKDAPAKYWDSCLRQVAELGFKYVDPTDAWMPLAIMDEARISEFEGVLKANGLAISSISMTRSSVVDVDKGDYYLDFAHKSIDLAPRFGASVVNIGFMQALTQAQAKAIWFWLEPGHVDDPALRDKAIERVRELGDHAKANGIKLSLEMYEDTFIGTPDDAVSFVRDVNHEAVGLNPDLGNLIRLHRPMPHFSEMFEKVLPYSNFWHIKNYTRDFDVETRAYSSAPVPLKYGYVNYRQVIRRALELGYAGPFCCEHYGSDSLGVCAENAEYIRQILTSALRDRDS